MRRIALTLLLLGLIALPAAAGAAEPPAEPWIVVLDDSVDSPSAVAREHGRRHGASVKHVYAHALKGYAARIPASRIADVRSDSRVAYVEPDGAMHAVAQTLPWGVQRTYTSGTGVFSPVRTVTNVNAYVIDSGIYSAHTDLRAVQAVNFAGGKNTDCNGHGTHVAGTVGAIDNTQDVVGVAAGLQLYGVKVLGCSGSGSTSGVIKGVDWVTANAARPAVANMSLGGGPSTALDNAVVKSANSGVVYSLAAGNSGVNACNESPARAGANAGVVTVAALDSANRETSWSNYGPCVDIWAPGSGILSTRRNGGTTTLSGTSMASPHVGGAAAVYLSSNTAATASGVEQALKGAAVSTGTSSKNGAAIKRLYAGGF